MATATLDPPLTDRIIRSLADSSFRGAQKKAQRYIELLQEAYGPKETAQIFVDKEAEISAELIGYLGRGYADRAPTANEVRGEIVEAVYEQAGVAIPQNVQQKINQVAGPKGSREIEKQPQPMPGSR